MQKEKKLVRNVVGLVCILLVFIVLFSWVLYNQVNAGSGELSAFEQEGQPVEEANESSTQELTATNAEASTEEPTEPPTEAPTQAPTEPPTEAPTEPPIENLQDNLSSWFLANDNTNQLTLWKKSNEEGNLLLALRNHEGETLVTFLYVVDQYDWISAGYQEWTLCDAYYAEFTAQDVVDVVFTAYCENGGKNPVGVQNQTMVVFNRDKSPEFANGIRGVITEERQYACKSAVLNRRLKSESFLEKEDLEKCFRVVILVYANEMVVDVPADIVWAAAFPQGSSTWMYLDGTYYAHR